MRGACLNQGCPRPGVSIFRSRLLRATRLHPIRPGSRGPGLTTLFQGPKKPLQGIPDETDYHQQKSRRHHQERTDSRQTRPGPHVGPRQPRRHRTKAKDAPAQCGGQPKLARKPCLQCSHNRRHGATFCQTCQQGPRHLEASKGLIKIQSEQGGCFSFFVVIECCALHGDRAQSVAALQE